MKISIAMAVYNGAKYLPAQLDSFAAQTRKPDEIIVSDDGSTDDTVDIICAWGAKHPEIGLRLLEGRGPGNFSGNFLRAFAEATGDLLFPSDQDDVWFPEKLAIMAELMELDSRAMVAIHDTIITDSELNPVGQQKIARLSMIGGAMQRHTDGMATVVRVPFLRLCASIPSGSSYDMWLHHCAYSLSVKRLVDQPLAYWRRHSSATTVSFAPNAAGFKSRLALNIGQIRFAIRNDRDGHDLVRTIERASHTREWLKHNLDALFDMGVSSDAIQNLEMQILDIIKLSEKRLAIRCLHPALRIFPVIKLLRMGGYQQFRGFYAAVKDIFI